MSEPRKIASDVTDILLQMSAKGSPEDFKTFFVGGIIANVVGNLPDDYWREMMKVEACGNPGCDCHKIQEVVMSALDCLRDDHKNTSQTPARN